jgi:hypothetical protein
MPARGRAARCSRDPGLTHVLACRLCLPPQLPLPEEQAVHQVALLPWCARYATLVRKPRHQHQCSHSPPWVFPLSPADSKIRIYDIGAKRTSVMEFPQVVHLVSDELEQVR